MRATGKFIMAKPCKIENKTSLGIYLAESASDEVYEVVSLGEGVREFKVGEKLILGPSYKGEKVKVLGDDYYFFNSDIVLGVL